MALTRFLTRTRVGGGFGVVSLIGRGGRAEYVPSIGKGLLLNMPLRKDTRMIYSAGGADGFSTETVDADGTYTERTAKGGLVTDATANTARIEDDGVRIESTKTNLCLQSEDMNTSWTASNVAIDTTSHTAPDGVANTKCEVRATAANGTLIQDLGAIASAAKAFSIYMKRVTGTGNIQMTLDGGSTWTTKTITSSWARYEITQTLADPDIGIRIVTDGDEVALWGGQCEAASVASSYIPTTTASVQRAGDLLDIDNASQVHAKTTGTLFLAFTSKGTNAEPYLFDILTATDGIICYLASSKPRYRVYSGGVLFVNLTATSALTTGTTVVVAVVWAANDARLYVNGGDEQADTSVTIPADMQATIELGSNGVAFQGEADIAHLLIYSDAKSAADIAKISAEIAEWMT